MNRGANSIVRTINLSQSKSFDKSFQMKKHINADDVMEHCLRVNHGTSYAAPRPVTVRICTRKQLEGTCPPKLGDPKIVPPSAKRNIVVSLGTAMAKGAIFSGLVYWTTAEGIWGDSSETEDLYYRMLQTVAPVLPDVPDLNEIKLPHLDSMKYSICDAYNHFVCNAIGGIVEIPFAMKKKFFDSIFSRKILDEESDGGKEHETSWDPNDTKD